MWTGEHQVAKYCWNVLDTPLLVTHHFPLICHVTFYSACSIYSTIRFASPVFFSAVSRMSAAQLYYRQDVLFNPSSQRVHSGTKSHPSLEYKVNRRQVGYFWRRTLLLLGWHHWFFIMWFNILFTHLFMLYTMVLFNKMVWLRSAYG